MAQERWKCGLESGPPQHRLRLLKEFAGKKGTNAAAAKRVQFLMICAGAAPDSDHAAKDVVIATADAATGTHKVANTKRPLFYPLPLRALS